MNNWKNFFSFMFSSSHLQQRIQTRTFSSKLDLRENPYFSKYAAKINEIQKSSPEKIEAITKEKNESCNVKLKEKNNKKDCHNMAFNRHQKDLKQIMKMDSIQDKSAEEIESIWKQYHSVKDGVYAVLPGDCYRRIYENLEKFPTFLFPLPKAQGYEFKMCQYYDQSCYFTSLINYQAFKENAPITLTVTYFTEFLENKNIALMRGEYDTNVLKVHEAQCLANQLQLYYGTSEKKRLLLLERFNRYPEDFKFMDLIANFESSF